MDEIIRVYLSKNLKAESLYNIKDNTLKVLKGSMVARRKLILSKNIMKILQD